MRAYLRHLEHAVTDNTQFRRVLYTTALMQLCVMCIEPREELGAKLHDADHFYFLVQGSGVAMVDGLELALSAGFGLLAPAGCVHNIANSGAVAMKLCEVVAPPHFRQGAVHRRRSDAEADEDPFETGIGTHSPTPEAQAHWMLGLLALHGLGVPLDVDQARTRFERAQQLGHPLACAGLAWCTVGAGAFEPAQAALVRTWLADLEPVRPARSWYLQWLLDQKLAAATAPASAGCSPTVDDERLLRAARAGDAQALLEMGLRNARTGRLAHAIHYFQGAAPRSPAAAANVCVVREYLLARGRPLHQSMPPLQSDPSPLFDLLPQRWRTARGGPAIVTREPQARAVR